MAWARVDAHGRLDRAGRCPLRRLAVSAGWYLAAAGRRIGLRCGGDGHPGMARATALSRRPSFPGPERAGTEACRRRAGAPAAFNEWSRPPAFHPSACQRQLHRQPQRCHAVVQLQAEGAGMPDRLFRQEGQMDEAGARAAAVQQPIHHVIADEGAGALRHRRRQAALAQPATMALIGRVEKYAAGPFATTGSSIGCRPRCRGSGHRRH
ncbi:Uncharacterised protein [Chromobacterium violaceum]|uniref:Uncharacterized protein n=1 Tax=Chromobacterium violaceum TaxID=536 RepID=A0A3S4JZB0_CHRVL|nr:Uncharacterised protein [Chromobacterium violaceum]